MELEKIVGEYRSKNSIVRNLFLKRLYTAIKLAEPTLQKTDTPNIIDIGCGEGLLFKLLKAQYPSIKMLGIDIEPNIIQLKKLGLADIRVMSITHTDLPSHSFDVAFCLDMLEHLTAKELKQAAHSIKKIIKTNGVLVTSLPTETWFYKLGRLLLKGTTSQIDGPGCSPHFHNAKEVETILSLCGFKKVQKNQLPVWPLPSLFSITLFSPQ